jgi:hypothetical protein
MSQLFDEITRIVGSQMPRRRALKLITKGLAGSALFTFGLRTGSDAFAVPSRQALGSCYHYLNCQGLPITGLVTQEDCCGPADEPCYNKSWRQQGTTTCRTCHQCQTGTGGNPSPSRPPTE